MLNLEFYFIYFGFLRRLLNLDSIYLSDEYNIHAAGRHLGFLVAYVHAIPFPIWLNILAILCKTKRTTLKKKKKKKKK